MTGGAKPGVAAALDLLGPGDDGEDAPEQLAFAALAPAEDVAAAMLGGAPSLHQAARQAREAEAQALVDPARRGRKPGSRNKRTAAFADYILSRYRSPLVVLAETWSRPVDVLAVELGCDKEDAFKIQQAAAVAALPYLHERQAVAVNLEGAAPVTLVIGSLEAGSGDGLDAAGDGVVLDIEVEENQALSGSDAEAVGQPELDNGAKIQSDQRLRLDEPLIADQSGASAAGLEGDR
ncbi:hypothetical protein [Zavarzinia sp. CC-PAN008]|uniref:hypothetical protein n=1 Tax=Zavarzinia sp. CC-PAN008 TaxID=3243332 RepID=UPI003F742E59